MAPRCTRTCSRSASRQRAGPTEGRSHSISKERKAPLWTRRRLESTCESVSPPRVIPGNLSPPLANVGRTEVFSAPVERGRARGVHYPPETNSDRSGGAGGVRHRGRNVVASPELRSGVRAGIHLESPL